MLTFLSPHLTLQGSSNTLTDVTLAPSAVTLLKISQSKVLHFHIQQVSKQ